jgi:D-alanyl-D-alanine carboxypeptidase (penicillin-binding protein 5/6)
LQTKQVWLGEQENVRLALEQDLNLTLPRGAKGELEIDMLSDEFIEAPIAAGQPVGTLIVRMGGEVQAERALVAVNAVEEAGFFGRLIGKIQLFFARLFA